MKRNALIRNDLYSKTENDVPKEEALKLMTHLDKRYNIEKYFQVFKLDFRNCYRVLTFNDVIRSVGKEAPSLNPLFLVMTVRKNESEFEC